jgi:predicted MFS family arabinose efflux permease
MPPTPRLLTREFVAILFAQAGFGYSMSAFQMLPKFLAAELGADPSQIGSVAAAFGLAAVAATLLGDVIDRLGRRRAVVGAACLMVATSLAFSAVDEVGPLVYGLRAVQGVAFVMAWVGGSSLAVEEAPPQRLGQALALFGLTMLSMNAVGPPLTEEIARRSGWPLAFATAAVGALACIALSALVRERPPAEVRGDSTPDLWSVVRQPRQLRVATVVVLNSAACGVMFAFHQPFALEVGITRVGSFFAAYATAAMGVRIGLGHLIDRLGRHRVASVCLALYAVAVTAMAALGRVGLVPLGGLFGVAHGLFYPAFNAIAVAQSPAQARGKVLTLFIGSFNLGFAGGPFALGYLADRSGYPLVFGVAGLLAFAALVVFLFSPESRTPPTETAAANGPSDR